MAQVELRKVVKHYEGNAEPTVRGIDLCIADREFVVLVGPSGCGKSTVLRMIAGLESVTSGDLLIGDRRVNDLHPKARNIAMVFQNYALFPNLTVEQNITFGLKVRGAPREERDRALGRAAGILGLEELLDRKPGELSGGQRQRVAVGRAIVREPEVFLFDEPLSNLDANLRGQMRSEIVRLHRQLDATMVYVTHDQVEAMTMAERIVVFEGGHIQQVAPPREIYEEPTNRFVAGFIGNPPMNFVEGEVQREGSSATFVSKSSEGLRLALGDAENRLPKDADGSVTLGVRPENLHLSGAIPSDVRASQEINLSVELVEYFGAESSVSTHVGSDSMILLTKGAPPSPGTDIKVVADLDRLHFFTQ